MSKLVVRHGLSEANNRENYGSPAFGNPDAPLIVEGWSQAQAMGTTLTDKYGIIPYETHVAVSLMRRSQETAVGSGFLVLKKYEALDEVSTGLPPLELRAAIDEQRAMPVVRKAAELLLIDPPAENIWITHGLLIAGLCDVLGVARDYDRYIPKFCEIRELPIASK